MSNGAKKKNTRTQKSDTFRDTSLLRPMNDKQKDYINAIKTAPVVICTGVWGSSKAQPLGSLVLTPKGFKQMGDISVGDKVVTPDNKEAEVLEVHPFKDKDVYEITLLSGRKVKACKDHLWECYVTSIKDDGEVQAQNQLCDTKLIIDCMDTYTFHIPVVIPENNMKVEYEEVVDISLVSKEDVQCILINSPEHLYITDNYIVTHNTYIPSVMACDMLLNKQIEKVVIARPTEGKGKSVGFFKGDKNEKLSGWVAPIVETMIKRLGEGNFEAFLENGKIELLALEQVKGRSWDDTFVLIDEAEDLEPAVAKSLVGRQGIRTTTVITGDLRQADIKHHSGLQTLLDVAHNYDMSIPHIDFNDWKYCVRSEEAKQWGMAFEAYEKEEGK